MFAVFVVFVVFVVVVFGCCVLCLFICVVVFLIIMGPGPAFVVYARLRFRGSDWPRHVVHSWQGGVSSHAQVPAMQMQLIPCGPLPEDFVCYAHTPTPGRNPINL